MCHPFARNAPRPRPRQRLAQSQCERQDRARRNIAPHRPADGVLHQTDARPSLHPPTRHRARLSRSTAPSAGPRRQAVRQKQDRPPDRGVAPRYADTMCEHRPASFHAPRLLPARRHWQLRFGDRAQFPRSARAAEHHPLPPARSFQSAASDRAPARKPRSPLSGAGQAGRSAVRKDPSSRKIHSPGA